VADEIQETEWNIGMPATAGVLSMNYKSPLWQVIGDESVHSYTVLYRNRTSFMQMDLGKNQLVIGKTNLSSSESVMRLETVRENQFTADCFMFGYYNESSQTEFFEDISPQESNTTIITTGIAGLGFPLNAFRRFENLLQLITVGQAACSDSYSEGCLLIGQC
jgi:hypothetical protein